MNVNWLDRQKEFSFKLGFEIGFKIGVEIGRRQVIEVVLEERFGPLSETVRDRLWRLPAERISPLAKVLLRAQSLRELGLED